MSVYEDYMKSRDPGPKEGADGENEKPAADGEDK